MTKRQAMTLALISIVSMCLSAVALMTVVSLNEQQKNHDVQYVMFLGTNSSKTYEPVFSHDEAKAKADEILFKHFTGFTIQEANGGWINDGGSQSHEYTLVILLSDTEKAKVIRAMDELLEVFEQSSILLQTNQTVTEFYSGGK
ncbi:MAG: DUF3574 domain-containing protein [Synergistaceae bacterium]|nr:DUF3574 domain-containing protein [Synergistaceae bacterium]MBR0094190.1 DUF3574 domain-containing protein [Synergistaceae bacterium]